MTTQEQIPKTTSVDKEKTDVEQKNDDSTKSGSKKHQRQNELENIIEEKDVNLIPVMTREELKREDRKKKIDKSSIVSFAILVSVSLLVIGFNTMSRIRLNSQKKSLLAYETRLTSLQDKINQNSEMLDRQALYQSIIKGQVSTKKIVDYLVKIMEQENGASLVKIDFLDSSSVKFDGVARDYESAAKIWYYLINDPNLEKIEMKDLSRSSLGISFSCTVHFALSNFLLTSE